MNISELLVGWGWKTPLANFAESLIVAALAFVISYFAIKILKKILSKILDRSTLELTLKKFAVSAINIVLWTIAIIIILPILGIEATSIVAAFSVAGLALSLSIQGIMSNVFSGITVLGSRPFVVDDYVELNGVSGSVSRIGFFYTVVKTVDNKLISIPNSEVTSAKIINYNHEPTRRVDFTFSASYDDSTESVKNAIMEVVKTETRILHEPAEPFVGLVAYKDSCIDYVLRVWVHSSDYWDVFFNINESVRESFAKNNVTMTYNHLNVHIVDDKQSVIKHRKNMLKNLRRLIFYAN